MKGIDILIGVNVGYMSAWRGQSSGSPTFAVDRVFRNGVATSGGRTIIYAGLTARSSFCDSCAVSHAEQFNAKAHA
jgi:hypothetical protein